MTDFTLPDGPDDQAITVYLRNAYPETDVFEVTFAAMPPID